MNPVFFAVVLPIHMITAWLFFHTLDAVLMSADIALIIALVAHVVSKQ